MTDSSSSWSPQENRFQTTHWSVVIDAGDQQSVIRQKALETLCERYWYPLYVFVRKSGHQTSDAQDLTQAFFERLIEKDVVSEADRDRGRFRTFLLTCLKNFISNEWKRSTREKRGGHIRHLSLDFAAAEQRLHDFPEDNCTAETHFNRQWAVSLLDKVVEDLRKSYSSRDDERLFEQLKCYLTADSQSLPYKQAADELGMTVGQVKVNVHRMRSRYRQLLESEIANTVCHTDEISDEIQFLFRALS